MSFASRHRARSRGFTIIELAAIIGVVVVLAAVVLPPIQRTRERARRAECAYNLGLIARACQQYESVSKTFPLGRNQQAYVDTTGSVFLGYHTGWSFHASLMPHLGRSAAFNAINFSLGPYQLRNSTVAGSMHGVLWCPADPEIIRLRCFIEQPDSWDRTTLGVTYTSYGGFMGSLGFGRSVQDYREQMTAQDGMFPDVGLPEELGGPGTHPPVRVADVTDGLGHTLLLGERAHGKLSKYNCGPGGHCSFRGNGWWAGSDFGDAGITAFYPPNFTPMDLLGTHALGDTGSPTARCDSATPFVMSASSFHPGGANFAFADGSVRFLRDSINSWDPRSVAATLNPSCVPSGTTSRGVFQAIATRAGGEKEGAGDL